MNYSLLFLILVTLTLLSLSTKSAAAEKEIETKETKAEQPKGRIFSLFNVVTFKNSGCVSNSGSSGSGSHRNGTCFTSQECQDRGGKASGNCALGFGVCCLFVVSASGTTISQNCTYIQNPGYPTALTSTSAIAYTIAKCSPDVCAIRLDFETFSLLGPVTTDEAATALCQDSFTFKGSSGLTSPVICGINTGQHLYMDISQSPTGTGQINFAFNALPSTIRQWEIKVTQIPCYSPSRPLDLGCLQYHEGITGRIQTFNFNEPSSNKWQHLPSQNYNVCIRQEAGYCCIAYSLCPDVRSWSLDNKSATAMTAELGSACSQDYISISGGGNTCSRGSNQPIYNTFCGDFFGAVIGDAANIGNTRIICDCSAPFQVQIVTDLTNDGMAPAAATEARGVCLNYQQIAC